jgi:hypothetical protein
MAPPPPLIDAHGSFILYFSHRKRVLIRKNKRGLPVHLHTGNHNLNHKQEARSR